MGPKTLDWRHVQPFAQKFQIYAGGTLKFVKDSSCFGDFPHPPS
ncbi:MAG TPA: hypothetical protein VK934_11670 [Fimbriimonas sp.]|nr:hypothetical protein [Fimbriimonas sp.]